MLDWAQLQYGGNILTLAMIPILLKTTDTLLPWSNKEKWDIGNAGI